MVRRITVAALLTFVFNMALSQELKVITVFDPLVDHTWEITGKWGNGLDFKQETTFKKEASGTIVTADTKSYLNDDQTEWGPRNHGIRQVDEASGKILFFEFDAFGRMTKGEVQVKENDFYYIYDYEGMTLCDKWEYVDEENYKYIIGAFKDGEIGEIYLEGQITRKD